MGAIEGSELEGYNKEMDDIEDQERLSIYLLMGRNWQTNDALNPGSYVTIILNRLAIVTEGNYLSFVARKAQSVLARSMQCFECTH
mgnify:CR=1 FL=1